MYGPIPELLCGTLAQARQVLELLLKSKARGGEERWPRFVLRDDATRSRDRAQARGISLAHCARDLAIRNYDAIQKNDAHDGKMDTRLSRLGKEGGKRLRTVAVGEEVREVAGERVNWIPA